MPEHEEEAEIEEEEKEEGMDVEECGSCDGARIEIARTPKNDSFEYFWLLYSKNGRQIATNPIPYKRLNDLKEAIKVVRETIGEAPLVRLY